MKKKVYVGVLLVLMLTLTGCTDKLKCTMEKEEEGYTTKQSINLKFDGKGKPKNADLSYEMIFDKEENAASYYEVLSSYKKDYDIKQEKNKIILKSTQDYSDNDETKEELKEQFENTGYTCK